MSSVFKRKLIIALTLIFLVSAVLIFSLWQARGTVLGEEPTSYILTFDNKDTVDKVSTSYPNRTAVSYSEGYLNVVSKYKIDEDGNISNPGSDKPGDGDGYTFKVNDYLINSPLEKMRYIQIKFCRENCKSARMQIYLKNKDGALISRSWDFENTDSKWVVLTLDLYETKLSNRKAINYRIYDEGGNFTDNNIAFSSTGGEFSGKLEYFYVNLGRQYLANKTAKVEYVAFFSALSEAEDYSGRAEERLNNAVSVLTSPNTELNSIFGNANTEEKALKQVSTCLSDLVGVGSEIAEYVYTPAKVDEKGKVFFNVRLWSAGLYRDLSELTMWIDETPSEPIMMRFNNQKTIDSINPADITVELVDGVMKMTKINARQEDCFFFTFTAPDAVQSFDLQSYPYIKLKFKQMSIGGKFQIYYPQNGYYDSPITGNGYERTFLVSFDTDAWLTVILDTSKTLNAVEILNLETNETSYESVYGTGRWVTTFTPEEFKGKAEEFRFTFGRKDNLDRTTYIEYISFFPTLEMARNYDEVGEKFKADAKQKIIDYDFTASYGDSLTADSAKDNVLNSVKELLGEDCDAMVETIDYNAAGYYADGEYKFRISVNNENYGVSFTTDELSMTLLSMEKSGYKLWKYNNDIIVSTTESLYGGSVEFDGNSECMKVTGTSEATGYMFNVPLNASFNMSGHKYIKIRYKSDSDFNLQCKFYSGSSYAQIESGKFIGDGEFNECLISVVSEELFVIRDGYKQSITSSFKITGRYDGIVEKFLFKATGSAEIYIDYICFVSDVGIAQSFDGVQSFDMMLENIKDINLYCYYVNGKNEDEAKDYIGRHILRTDASVKSIMYGEYSFVSGVGGKLPFSVTYTVGDLASFATKTVSGVLTVAAEPGDSIIFTGKYDFVNYIDIDDEYYLMTEKDLTAVPTAFEAYVYVEDYNSNGSLIVGNADNYAFIDADGKLALYSGGNIISSETVIKKKNWIKVKVEFSDNHVAFFVDDEEVADGNCVLATNDKLVKKVNIGGFGINDKNLFGRIKFTKVYNGETVTDSWKLGARSFDGTFVNDINAENFVTVKNIYGHLYHEFLGGDYLYTASKLTETPNTFETWLRLSSENKGSEQVIVSNAGLKMYVLANGNVGVNFGSSHYESENIDLFNDSWTHLAVVRDLNVSAVYLYINGESVTLTATGGELSDSDADKSGLMIGAETFDYLGRNIPNDVVLYVENAQSGVILRNDNIVVTIESSKLSINFYNDNSYSYNKALLGDTFYLRIVVDNVGFYVDLYVSETIEGVFDTDNIVDEYALGEQVEHTWKWINSKFCSFDSRNEETSFKGYMGDFRVWSSARTQAQIVSDMRKIDFTDRENLLAQWKLDYSESLIYADFSGNDCGVKIYANRYFRTNMRKNNSHIMVFLPDTQNYVAFDSTYMQMTDPENNDVIAQWIVDNAEYSNMVALAHCGDVTQNATMLEWKWVYKSYSIMDGVIPYLFTMGNHDYPSLSGKGCEIRDASNYNYYWNYDKYSQLLTEIADGFGTFEEGKMENAYMLFSDGTHDFILFVVELDPRDEVCQWVDKMAKKYSDRNAIMVTHCFMKINTKFPGEADTNSDGLFYGMAKESTFNEAVDMLEKIIYKNDNFIAVYCGHQGASDLAFSLRTVTTYGGKDVQVMIVDTSAADKHFPSNAGVIGLTEYDDDGNVRSYMYSPLHGTFFNTDDVYEYSWGLI